MPVSAAVISRENGIDTFLVMSSIGADPKSSVFYSRTKGEMERDVLKARITNTYILRPSLILGKRNENRFGESIAKAMFYSFQFLLIDKLKKYRAVEGKTIAQSMIYLANEKPNLTVLIPIKLKSLP